MPRMSIDGPVAQQRILSTARTLFCQYGYDSISTAMIAKEARVSKSTLYKQVGDKKAILLAVVKEEIKRFFDPEFSLPSNLTDYRKMLIDFGVNTLSILGEKDLRSFDQLMVGQAMTNPQIAMDFYEHSYARIHGHLINIINFGQTKGYIKRQESADFLTEILCHSLAGHAYQRAMYGYEYSIHTKARERTEKVLRLILEI